MMYLLDHMERGTPQRKTVYRISLTLVKKESLAGSGVESGSVRRDSGLLEQLKEVHNESEELPGSRSFMRTFRTFSMGQLELGRLKVSRRLLVEDRGPGPGLEGPGGSSPGTRSGPAVDKRLLKTRRVEDQRPPSSPLRPGLLRCSFRPRTSGDLLRLWTGSKNHDCRGSGSAQTPPASRTPHPPMERSRTLEVGAVLNRTSSLTELGRCETVRGARNRTLDNSDLLGLAGGARSTDRRLTRFFSGIFSRRDRTSSLDPGRTVASESANGGRTEGDRLESGTLQGLGGPERVRTS